MIVKAGKKGSGFPQSGKEKLASQGFSLIEATIALTTLGICLAYAMPLFLYSKMNNIKSEVRSGAMMVSQQIFDDIRGLPFETITLRSSSAKIINLNGTEASAKTSSTIPKDTYRVMNRPYTANVFFCEVAIECNDNNYKTFRVEVMDQNGRIVYGMEAGFTNFR